MTFKTALHAAIARPTDADALAELAESALTEGEEEQAIPILVRALEKNTTAQLWQWKGLLERSLDEHEQALGSFEHASRLEPASARIAHGHARVALEAGVPVESLYERARALAPGDGSVLIGLAAARLAAGRGEAAEAELDRALEGSPLWIEGHHQLGQLRSMLGRPGDASASLHRALRGLPNESRLWRALFDLRIKTDDFDELAKDVAAARKTSADPWLLKMHEAIATAEMGGISPADRLFDEIVRAMGESALAVWRIRHLLRTRRYEPALTLIDRQLEGPGAAVIWPYAGLAWRLTGDARWDWLEGGGKLVSIVDLSDRLPPLDLLSDSLRSIHKSRGEYLDQSVRGGTQTDGPLFSRIEPQIRRLRSAVVEAVGTYSAQLPPIDADHPLLRFRRDRRVRFAGSWSVRLKEEGFHVSHVHPQGWISSALYVALPHGLEAEKKEGWLQIGAPRSDLALDLEPVAHIKPEPGKLVLFPSWMWHGTTPFPAGERLSVAFDVAPPR